ncbi:DUF1850 domain-containing protein [Amaricoccus solimangrovi]|uniref:DUF1850 domain-containing protein n=1 Tax=Amaricoccus solimangrovi TaxID=2589815 RepID=A0A501WPS1_9RHOB|nr:DUF1850 domain-containing protein [Amaricoccus solimangrovi]TPE49237.1 DUF1850 domain-containing protein [Amaricoccus solimangrovi]
MSLCLALAGGVLRLAVTGFTLSWTHSVERVEWWERWAVTPAGLRIEEARVRGSGAGMEPPEGARRVAGGWDYRPDLPPLPELVLAASGATGGGWTLCAAGECRVIGAEAGPPVTLSRCAGD